VCGAGLPHCPTSTPHTDPPLTPDCTDCRRFTGDISAYIIAFPIEGAEVKGHPAQWTTRADSGYNATRFFCAKCGSSMYSHHDVRDPRVFMNGGGYPRVYMNGGGCVCGGV
jgi:hypothetical protein